uniref:Anaphase-promoting complex subunit 2 n=2 Tax=Leersia perrieri TaxID=77586 RepID=A0A0D9W6D7_9ORYZ
MQLEGADGALDSWARFCALSDELFGGAGDLSAGPRLAPAVADLCARGLAELLRDHFLRSLEEIFRSNAVKKFWQQFHPYCSSSPVERINFCVQDNWPEDVLSRALEDICLEKSYQEKCVLALVHSFQSYEDRTPNRKSKALDCSSSLMPRYQLMVSSVLLTTLPLSFPEILNVYFKKKLEELSTMMAGSDGSDPFGNHDVFERSTTSDWHSEMDIDGQEPVISECRTLVKNIGKVVRDLRYLGFTSMTEDAYSSAIIWLLKSKVHELAGDDYRVPVLGSVKKWIQAVPLKFLHALLTYLGDSVDNESGSGLKSPLASRPSSFPGIGVPSEALVRWHMRLEYFAYETLQDLRIGKLFEIIVDYPESSPAIEDLKHCLEYTGQHSKLVDSFISSLRYRLLTAGASTNDILHQYVSTIKALRTIDPTGVFLEAVGEPIRDYLRCRKDTIKCIVTMLTDGSGGNTNVTGNAGDNLLEELNRDAENQENVDYDDHTNIDEKQAWLNAESWEPDPVEADPLKGSRNRRKIDILGLIVSIIGSKDQLVNEYRVMLAEKLLNKSGFDIDSDIRTLELLKIHFGESSMQKCEIMLNDLIDSKRTNSNIKTSLSKTSQTEGTVQEETDLSHDVLDATIISSNFWPPIQTEDLTVPASVDQLLSDYAKRFHQIKTPRKLLWKKNLGTVKLELQFEDRSMQFTVAPVHAAIIMQFQEKPSWTSKTLATAIGVHVDSLNRRISFWTSKGVLTESVGPDHEDHIFTVVDSTSDFNKNSTVNQICERFEMTEEGESSIASVEEQLRKEMTVYEMFCIAEPSYDKSLQQLQSFLSGLVSDEKLDMRDGSYLLRKMKIPVSRLSPHFVQ